MEHSHLITAIEAEADRSGLKPTTICQYAVKNRRLYDNLVKGLDCRRKTAQRLLDWIAARSERAVQP